MPENNRKKGSRYEDTAAVFLMRHGYKLRERNFYTRSGEIDIIAEEDQYLVFVEVKYRSGIGNGYPEEAVTSAKQRKIINTARYYMLIHGINDMPVRFDVVAVMPDRIRLIKNAFGTS